MFIKKHLHLMNIPGSFDPFKISSRDEKVPFLQATLFWYMQHLNDSQKSTATHTALLTDGTDDGNRQIPDLFIYFSTFLF